LFGEVALIGKAARGRDFVQGQICLSEKLTGVIDPELTNVLSDGGAIVFSEFTHQVNPMNACQSGEFG